MKRASTILMVAALTSLFWLLPAQAEEPKSEGIARVALITAKDGHDKDLLEAIEKYHHWVATHDDYMKYTWYEILTGPNTGKYIARTGNHNWADFDAKHDWDEEAGKKFAEEVAPHIADFKMSMTRTMHNFSNFPEDWTGYTHFQIQDWYVRNGQGGKFRKGLKRIVDTLKANGFPDYWAFTSVESGGHGGQITLVGFNKGWADMSEDNPSFYEIMKKELGGDEQFEAFMSDWGSTFKPGGSRTIKLLPDASSYE